MSKKRHRHKRKKKLLTQQDITERYGTPREIVRKYFPPSGMTTIEDENGNSRSVRGWTEKTVAQALERRDVRRALEQMRVEQEERTYRRAAHALFADYSPDTLIERARELERSFVLHVGPTNSGKTYEALEDLQKYTPGCYLAPLRLLAMEIADKINAAGIPCSMVTGEEAILLPEAQVVSSTIELCDYSRRVKTAVIDEAQLIANPDRGASWLKAICLVNAEVVHICMAPEALPYIEHLVEAFGSPYSITRHKRLAPLRYSGSIEGYGDLHPDDAIICFSRRSVLSTAALLERNGFSASVIYGALPPEARRNEVRKYLAGETNIVVATDAIGMGISLPIRRVIFAELEKFDGKAYRPLSISEINQIGGRAGRYGLHECGEVLVLGNSPLVRDQLGNQSKTLRTACIAFPREALESEIPLHVLLKTWQSMPKHRDFIREDMTEPLILLKRLKVEPQEKRQELVYDLITCPVDVKVDELVQYWKYCARAILAGERIPRPWFDTNTLLGCELQYKAFDIHHQLLRRIGQWDDCSAERTLICERIDQFMRASKAPYIRRCRQCNAELPIGSISNYCDACLVEARG